MNDLYSLLLLAATLLVFTIFYILPIIAIRRRPDVSHREKILWMLAVVFISWGAFLFFWRLAPLFNNDDNDPFRMA
ncbi:MAG: hypothetical protein HWE13_10600 [Gammaproteobacteria bacterium]|nr:hypothetical protein [Gammaproteobacteria bacterium]